MPQLLERGQPLQDIQEVPAHAAELVELALGQAFGRTADEDHEKRHQWRCKQQYQAGDRVGRQNDDQDGQRRHEQCRRIEEPEDGPVVVGLGDAHELAERLTDGGLEVDSVEPAASAFTGVVVGEILGLSA